MGLGGGGGGAAGVWWDGSVSEASCKTEKWRARGKRIGLWAREGDGVGQGKEPVDKGRGRWTREVDCGQGKGWWEMEGDGWQGKGRWAREGTGNKGRGWKVLVGKEIAQWAKKGVRGRGVVTEHSNKL